MQPYRLFPDQLLVTVRQRLRDGQRVRRTLPNNGRLHIDRQLPFICVYRRPARRPDAGTERFVTAQASYLVVSGAAAYQADVERLLQTVIGSLAPLFGGFLVVEIWSEAINPRDPAADDVLPQPAFTISLGQPPLAETVTDVLETRLTRIRVHQHNAIVKRAQRQSPQPRSLPPLLTTLPATPPVYRVGIALDPIYRDTTTGDIRPLILKSLLRAFTYAVQRLFFQFSRYHTDISPPHYQSLGRRALVKAVWQVDQRLADIEDQFNLLLQVSPVNTDEAWAAFKHAHFERPPMFHYRPLAVDPTELKRRLWAVRVERLEDPTLEHLFQEKRLEIDTKLDMLLELNTPLFLYSSVRLYGLVAGDLYATAQRLLEGLPARSREKTAAAPPVTAREFQRRAEQTLAEYRADHPDLTASTEIRSDVANLMVVNGRLLINSDMRIPPNRVNALIHHEVSTHILTAYNGKRQPLRQLETGLAGYNGLQEGLAVLAEYLVGGLDRQRMRILAARVIAAGCILQGASFIETFRLLTREYHFTNKLAFHVTTRIYRGGGYTKDYVYLLGLLQALDYVKSGKDLPPLFVGKIAAHHLPIVLELQRRGVLDTAALLPRYLQFTEVQQRLAAIQAANLTLFDLIKGKRT